MLSRVVPKKGGQTKQRDLHVKVRQGFALRHQLIDPRAVRQQRHQGRLEFQDDSTAALLNQGSEAHKL